MCAPHGAFRQSAGTDFAKLGGIRALVFLKDFSLSEGHLPFKRLRLAVETPLSAARGGIYGMTVWVVAVGEKNVFGPKMQKTYPNAKKDDDPGIPTRTDSGGYRAGNFVARINGARPYIYIYIYI